MNNGRLRKKETIGWDARPLPNAERSTKSQGIAREEEAFIILFCNRERI